MLIKWRCAITLCKSKINAKDIFVRMCLFCALTNHNNSLFKLVWSVFIPTSIQGSCWRLIEADVDSSCWWLVVRLAHSGSVAWMPGDGRTEPGAEAAAVWAVGLVSPIVEGVSEVVDESFGASKGALARACPGVGTTGIPDRALTRDEDEGSRTAAACADTGTGVWICAGTGICVGAETETGERTGATSVGGARKLTPDAFVSALPQGPVGRVGKTGWTGAKMGISPKFPCDGAVWKKIYSFRNLIRIENFFTHFIQSSLEVLELFFWWNPN